jgi:hypothetical protein
MVGRDGLVHGAKRVARLAAIRHCTIVSSRSLAANAVATRSVTVIVRR